MAAAHAFQSWWAGANPENRGSDRWHWSDASGHHRDGQSCGRIADIAAPDATPPPGERYIIRSEMPLRRIGEKPRVSGTRSKEDITQFLGARGWLLERDTAESSVDFAFAGHCVECRTPGHQCRVGGFTGGGGFSL